MSLTATDDQQLVEAMRLHGTVTAAADALGIARTTFRRRLRALEHKPILLEPGATVHPLKDARVPKLTRAALDAALKPPNNCKVKQFRDALDSGSQRVLDEALAYDRQDLSASRLRSVLVEAGFPDADVPGVDAINAHRSGARPCRCKG